MLIVVISQSRDVWEASQSTLLFQQSSTTTLNQCILLHVCTQELGDRTKSFIFYARELHTRGSSCIVSIVYSSSGKSWSSCMGAQVAVQATGKGTSQASRPTLVLWTGSDPMYEQ